jgi:hypothetical protein
MTLVLAPLFRPSQIHGFVYQECASRCRLLDETNPEGCFSGQPPPCPRLVTTIWEPNVGKTTQQRSSRGTCLLSGCPSGTRLVPQSLSLVSSSRGSHSEFIVGSQLKTNLVGPTTLNPILNTKSVGCSFLRAPSRLKWSAMRLEPMCLSLFLVLKTGHK